MDGDDLDKLSFNNAVQRVCSYWNGLNFDGFPVIPKGILCHICDDVPEPYNDFSEVKENFANVNVARHPLKTDMTMRWFF